MINSKLPVSTALCTIIIPIYNEEETLPTLKERLLDVVSTIDMQFEIILVDDGSRDLSATMIKEIVAVDGRFKSILLSRNFGHQIAITAGLDYAQGSCAVIMDADLQDPPEAIKDMVKLWRQGFDVVYGVRRTRAGETLFKKVTAKIFYRLIKKLVTFDIPTDAGDFRLLDRKVIDAFTRLREKNRYVRGLFSWIGFRHTPLLYDRAARFAGETKYPFSKMFKLAIDGVLSFSNQPLRFALKLGSIMAISSLVGGFVALVLKISGGFVVRGWTSSIMFMAFTSGIQLTVLGVIGEYIARINDEVKGRPLYFVREEIGNFSDGSVRKKVGPPKE